MTITLSILGFAVALYGIVFDGETRRARLYWAILLTLNAISITWALT